MGGWVAFVRRRWLDEEPVGQIRGPPGLECSRSHRKHL